MSIKSCSNVKTSVALIRSDYLYTQLYKNTSRYYLKIYYMGPC